MAASSGLKLIKFAPNLREIRLHLCQKSAASKGVREFIEAHYVTIKKQNPSLPILIRECSGIYPKAYARYDLGKESHAPLTNLSSEEVLKTIQKLTNQST